MRDHFKIAGKMLEHVGQGLPRRVALFDLQGVTGQAGMVGIQINLIRFVELGQGRHGFRPWFGVVGLLVSEDRM